MSASAESAGIVLGRLIAPLFAATSKMRHGRTFHPRGDLVRAEVVPAADTPHRALAEKLAGPALVRLSSALVRGARWPDVLGFAIRFGRDGLSPESGDQDLLFATIKRPWTMPFSPFTTKVHDYLANDYFAVSPFDTPSMPHAYFRLRPVTPSESEGNGRDAAARRALLEDAIRGGRAEFAIEIGPKPFGPWSPLARVTLVELLTGDPPPLAFDPFRDGRGLRPSGFVHALRRGVYRASRRAR
jgi:hypothetical protein